MKAERREHRPADRRGFSLIEVLLALVVVAFGLFVALDLMAANQDHARRALHRTVATDLARAKMAEIQAAGFEAFEDLLPAAADAPTSPSFFPAAPVRFEPPYRREEYFWQARFDRLAGTADAANVELRVYWLPAGIPAHTAPTENSLAIGGLLVRREAAP